MKPYAKVIIQGSPISKSNFKLFNMKGRAILPFNSGKYHDRYAIYEEEIAYQARIQNPGIFLEESLIAVLKVYYKSRKRHPDTTNITKSIFDGIEKSGLIINDAQVRRLIIEEYYDVQAPRFELELYGESCFSMTYTIGENLNAEQPILYTPPSNKKRAVRTHAEKADNVSQLKCEICGKTISEKEKVSADNGKTIFCRDCLKKLF